MNLARVLTATTVALAFAACGEKVQTIPVGAAKKIDGQPWQIQDNGYLAPGWTPGDEASWNKQLTLRAQAQNDYAPRK